MSNDRRGVTHVHLDEVPARELLRMQRLARELRLTDQILSIDLDTVSVVADGPAPAWTTLDGDEVSFAYGKMPKPKERVDVAVWLGTNAHELGHVLYSPRKATTLMYRVIESDRAFLPGIATMHNIVEDQRQERLLLARFTPWTGYLTAALGHHLVADDESAWLLMCGRTWLPSTVRAQARARMIATRGQRDTDEVTRLVGEYQRLTDPGDTEADEAWELLQELHRMFEDAIPRGGGCGGGVMEGGEPTTEPGEGDGGWPTADEDAEPGESDDSGDDADGDSDDDAGDDDGGDGATGDGKDGKGDTPSPQSEPSGKGESGGAGGAGAGNQPADPTKPINQADTRKALKDAAKDVLEHDDDAKADLDSITEALDYGRPGDRADGADPVGRYEDATDEARMLYHEVGDALLDLKDESEPGWNKRVESGRLNVRRAIFSKVDADEMYDRYDPGMMDASELEVCLLVDVSGSMQSAIWKLAEAVWAIRHAVDDLEGVITVITYESGPHRILAEPGVRPDDRMFVPMCTGGTEPKTAIREAYRLLAAADAKNRLFIVLTDGDWYSKGNDDTIKALGQSGVVTVCALIETGFSYHSGDDFHGCDYGAKIDVPSDLARLFRRVATDRISSWL